MEGRSINSWPNLGSKPVLRPVQYAVSSGLVLLLVACVTPSATGGGDAAPDIEGTVESRVRATLTAVPIPDSKPIVQPKVQQPIAAMPTAHPVTAAPSVPNYAPGLPPPTKAPNQTSLLKGSFDEQKEQAFECCGIVEYTGLYRDSESPHDWYDKIVYFQGEVATELSLGNGLSGLSVSIYPGDRLNPSMDIIAVSPQAANPGDRVEVVGRFVGIKEFGTGASGIAYLPVVDEASLRILARKCRVKELPEKIAPGYPECLFDAPYVQLPIFK